MSLREKINEQFYAAQKSKNKTLVSTLRLILAAIKERDIAVRSGSNKENIKDPEIIKVLRKMKKQREDSVKLYQKGGRQDLLEVEKKEIGIIEAFLPKQLSEAETKKICEEAFKLDHTLQCFLSPSKNWHAYKFFHKPRSTKEVAEEAMNLGRKFKKLG